MMTNQQIVELWLHTKASTTRITYFEIATKFLEYSGKHLSEITSKDFVDWINSLSPHLKKTSLSSKIHTIKSLLTFCYNDGHLQRNPGWFVKAPKLEWNDTVHIKSLHLDGIEALIEAAKSTRDRLMMTLGFVAGLRACELARLTWGDINGEVIRINGKGSKERFLTLPNGLGEELLQLRLDQDTPDSPVFRSRKNGPLGTRAISRIVKDAAIASGQSDKVSAHWLRHSHVNNAVRMGVDYNTIRKTMGHTSFAGTVHYLGGFDDDVKAQSSSQFLKI